MAKHIEVVEVKSQDWFGCGKITNEYGDKGNVDNARARL